MLKRTPSHGSALNDGCDGGNPRVEWARLDSESSDTSGSGSESDDTDTDDSTSSSSDDDNNDGKSS